MPTKASAPAAIRCVEDLRAHLQAAIELEHSTIPPYLAALYTIRPGQNLEAVEIIRSVVVQEMLHMVLAANVLNAIGGHPAIDDPAFVPEYPASLPVGGRNPLLVNVRRFSPDAVDTFLAIEKPARPISKSRRPRYRGDLLTALRRGKVYASIGDFYEAIEAGLKWLEAEARAHGASIFVCDPARQVSPEYYYNSGGKVVMVCNLESAIEALSEIINQGEGYGNTIDDGDEIAFHQPSEIAHYYRFKEIRCGRRYGPGDKPADEPSGQAFQVQYGEDAVYPMIDNPNPGKYADPTLIAKSHAFSLAYTELLKTLHQACNGVPARLLDAVVAMFALRNQAIDLIRNPLGDGEHAGPCFSYTRAASSGAYAGGTA